MTAPLFANIKKLCLMVLTCFLTIPLIAALTYAASAQGQDDEQRDFPSLRITSERHPFRQAREFWHNGTLTLDSDNPDWNFDDVDVRLRGRGNSTWIAAPNKRPLRIRFETPQEMFGQEAHRDWILLANAFDGSLLRTHFTFYFASLLGDSTIYVPSSQFVHLYINGQYVGVYQLTDERDNGPGRGNVRIDGDPAVSEYWLEMDMRTDDFFSINGRYYDIRMPSGNNLTQAHINYAYEFLLAVSEAIRARDWNRITALIDVQSFVDFYIVQEWSKELDIIDVSVSSVFMQILGQGENRRLVMGPFWDFDESFGNHNLDLWGVTSGPVGDLWAQRNYWFRNLMQVQQFRNEVALRWIETESAREAAFENLEYMARVYERAFERNFQVQPMFASPWMEYRSPYILAVGANWMCQVEYLVYFAQARANWLDIQFLRFSDVTPSDWFYDHVMTVYNADIIGGWSPSTFAPNHIITRYRFERSLANLFGVDISSEILNPFESITREEMAVRLYDYVLEFGIQLSHYGSANFSDIQSLPVQSQNAIIAMSQASIIFGRDMDMFVPFDWVTRAEASVVIARLMAAID